MQSFVKTAIILSFAALTRVIYSLFGENNALNFLPEYDKKVTKK